MCLSCVCARVCAGIPLWCVCVLLSSVCVCRVSVFICVCLVIMSYDGERHLQVRHLQRGVNLTGVFLLAAELRSDHYIQSLERGHNHRCVLVLIFCDAVFSVGVMNDISPVYVVR